MCKVLLIAGIKSKHLSKVHELVKAASTNMSIVEDDGVGYAAITKDGNIYGEKWLNKAHAFKIHSQPKNDPITDTMVKLFGDMAEWTNAPVTQVVYDSFGNRTAEAVESTVGIILHARKATRGAKVIENVHPFVVLNTPDEPDTALIHNGSIANHEKLTKTMSTCDSEVILHEYLANRMYHNPWGIEQLSKTLAGEYVVGVLSSMTQQDGSQAPIMDVFKANDKDLHAAYIPEIETMVFCTSTYTLENSCKEVGLTIQNMVKIKEGFLLRLDATTGEKIDEIIPFKVSTKYDNYLQGPHIHSMVPRKNEPQASLTPKDIRDIQDRYSKEEDEQTVEKDKASFERRHPSLFTLPYVEVNQPLEAKERELFIALNAGKETNHKALHLVAVALATVGVK